MLNSYIIYFSFLILSFIVLFLTSLTLRKHNITSSVESGKNNTNYL